MSQPIPNAVPCLRGNEWLYLKECLDSNWVSSVGPFVERFEVTHPAPSECHEVSECFAQISRGATAATGGLPQFEEREGRFSPVGFQCTRRHSS